MARRRKRKSQGRFARLPSVLLQGPARELSAATFRVWVALCDQSQDWNNGTASLCRAVIRAYGLGSPARVTRAKNELLAAGLIVQTRTAAQRRMAMYGVTHIPLAIDAMAKVGASRPGALSAQASDAPATGIGCAEPRRDPLALGHRTRIRPVTRTLALGHRITSETLPSASQQRGPDPSVAELLERIRAAGGYVTTNGRSLRVRWYRGIEHGLQGLIAIHQRVIYEHLMRRPPPAAAPRDAGPLARRRTTITTGGIAT